jgi:hypothetical protein
MTMASLRRIIAALGGMQLTAAGRCQTPATRAASSLLSESTRSIASATNENVGMWKFYKSLGMKPPQPRKLSPDAQKVHDQLSFARLVFPTSRMNKLKNLPHKAVCSRSLLMLACGTVNLIY